MCMCVCCAVCAIWDFCAQGVVRIADDEDQIDSCTFARLFPLFVARCYARTHARKADDLNGSRWLLLVQQAGGERASHKAAPAARCLAGSLEAALPNGARARFKAADVRHRPVQLLLLLLLLRASTG